MQIQMEVCDLDAVEFVEAKFAQRPVGTLGIRDQVGLTNAKWKGEIEVRGHFDDLTSWRYRYSEPVEDACDAFFTDDADLEALPLLEHSVWWLQSFHPRTVLRNRDWWNSVGWPNAELFWAEVLSLRDQQGNSTDKIVHMGGWAGR